MSVSAIAPMPPHYQPMFVNACLENVRVWLAKKKKRDEDIARRRRAAVEEYYRSGKTGIPDLSYFYEECNCDCDDGTAILGERNFRYWLG